MKYEVVNALELWQLETKVEKKLENGWTLQGGIHVLHVTGVGNSYLQAMVKNETK